MRKTMILLSALLAVPALAQGPVGTAARGSYSFIGFDGQRFFVSDAGEEAVERTIEGEWDGSLVSASGARS